MSTYTSSPGSLWSSGPFRRFAACSAAGHVAALILAGYGLPRSRWDAPPAVTVELTASLPVEEAAPEPAPEPAKPEPVPEPPPPEPEPEAVPEKQIIDEAVVIPEKLEEVKPKPAPPVPKPKPKRPERPKPKPEPQVNADDLMAELRKSAQTRPGPQAASSGTGRIDPELAEYLGKVKACLYTNWVGAGQYQRRQDLSAQFEVKIGPGGEVREVELVRGTGIEAIDGGAAKAIQKCSPFGAPPRGETLIPVVFRPGETG